MHFVLSVELNAKLIRNKMVYGIMERRILSKILRVSSLKKREVEKYAARRYLYHRLISVPKEYYIGVYGLRGIGKTVLLLQLSLRYKDSVYFSSDASYLRPYSLYDIVEVLRKEGYKNIFIDEVQYKSYWKEDIKTLYDEGEVRIFFTGSSQIDISHRADLSRRVRIFELMPVTFGEYLYIKKGLNVPALNMEDMRDERKRRWLVENYAHYAEYMEEYLRTGGVLYPGSEGDIYSAMRASVERAITGDLSTIRVTDARYQEMAYKLLYMIATSKPFEASYSSIANALEISKNTAKMLIYSLSKIGLLKNLLPCESAQALVRKEPKLHLPIPLRSYLNWELGREPEIGSLREDFFVFHMLPDCYLKGKRGEKTSDFMVKGTVFEVGGRAKSRVQNPDYIVVDGLTVRENRIPLFLIGFINIQR